MGKHKKRTRDYVDRAKTVISYYLLSAGICAVIYLFINLNAPIGKLAATALLYSIPLALLLLVLQKPMKKVFEPFSRTEAQKW